MKIPRWLTIALIPLVFLGGCVASVRPIWAWQDRLATHPVTEAERDIVPLLALRNGKHVVTGQSGAEGATIVTSVTRDDEKRINRDLCDLIGWDGYYRWFQILEEKDGVVRVSLEAPTRKDSKRKGWYSIHNGSIRPERLVYYGPGFAFVGLPWNCAAGIACAVIYWLLVRKLHRPNPSPEATPAHRGEQ